jgi:conserved oligomeric Golgi complex subunit 5
VFQQFLCNEFDAKAHATRVIQSHAISQQLARLAEGINLLDKELHSQVIWQCFLLF